MFSNPSTNDPDYSPDELEFIAAMERFQKESKVRFPTYTQMLAVAVSLGYRKVEEPTALPKRPIKEYVTGNPTNFRHNPTPRRTRKTS